MRAAGLCACSVAVSVAPHAAPTTNVYVRHTVSPGAIAPYDCGPDGDRTPPVASSVPATLALVATPALVMQSDTSPISKGSSCPFGMDSDVSVAPAPVMPGMSKACTTLADRSALRTWALAPMPRAAKPDQMSSRLGGGAAASIGRREDRIAALQQRRVDRVELHAVGHKLQDPLVAGGPAQARDEARPHLEERAGPDLADVVHWSSRIGR